MNLPIMTVPIVLLLTSAAVSSSWVAWSAVVLQAVILVGGLALWWMAYLFGVTMPWAVGGTDVSWSELHQRTYEHTIIVLPPIGSLPRPNLEHMILHALMLVGLALAAIASAGPWR